LKGAGHIESRASIFARAAGAEAEKHDKKWKKQEPLFHCENPSFLFG